MRAWLAVLKDDMTADWAGAVKAGGGGGGDGSGRVGS